jgi:hypothetical protein
MMFYVLFVCKCVLPPGVNPIAVDKCINTYLLLYVQCWTPDDGRKDRPKHLEWYVKKIIWETAASGWYYYYRNILRCMDLRVWTSKTCSFYSQFIPIRCASYTYCRISPHQTRHVHKRVGRRKRHYREALWAGWLRPEKTEGSIMDVKCDRMFCNNSCIRKGPFIVLKPILGEWGVRMCVSWVWKWPCRTQVSPGCTDSGGLQWRVQWRLPSRRHSMQLVSALFLPAHTWMFFTNSSLTYLNYLLHGAKSFFRS